MQDTFFALFAPFCPIKGVVFWLFLGNCKVANRFSYLESNPISEFYSKIELKTKSQRGTAGLNRIRQLRLMTLYVVHKVEAFETFFYTSHIMLRFGRYLTDLTSEQNHRDHWTDMT